MKYEICNKLELSVWHDGTHVRVRLEDPLELTESEVSSEMNVTTLVSREYHAKESIVIAIRQLVAQAFEVGMMHLDIKTLPKPVLAKPRRENMLPTALEEDILDIDVGPSQIPPGLRRMY